jgi:hypothetical protein
MTILVLLITRSMWRHLVSFQIPQPAVLLAAGSIYHVKGQFVYYTQV